MSPLQFLTNGNSFHVSLPPYNMHSGRFSIHMGRVIKVQHARMFKDRSARPSAVGLHDDSTSESERSKSRSRVSSRSRSRSRSSRSWSRSSSRLSFFSRIYGDSRARSRESSRSRSRSKSRSGSSFMTLSSAGSTSRSASRSRSGSGSRVKHRYVNFSCIMLSV